MKKWLLLFFLVLAPIMQQPEPIIQAQDEEQTACNALIREAIARVANVCVGIGRNEICYGNELISATLVDDSYLFEAPGDIVPIEAVDTLITRPADPDTGEWGIGLMDLQADLPADSDGSVRLLLYGGVEIEPQLPIASTDSNCTAVNDNDNVRLRSGPGTEYDVIDVLDRGTIAVIDGRNNTGEWLHTPRGWVASWVVTVSCEISQLPTLADTITTSSPDVVQAFTVRMDDEARCQAAPSGLLIQSPTGETANLRINNVDLSIGSTAFLTVRNDNRQLSVTNLQGNVRLISNGVSRDVRPGRQSRVEFDEAGNAGEPSEPIRPDQETLQIEFDVVDDLIDTDYFVDTALEICFDETINDYDADCLDDVLGDFEDLGDVCYDAVLDEYDEECLNDLGGLFEDPAEVCFDYDTGTYDEDCLSGIAEDTDFDLCYDPATDSFDETCLEDVLNEDTDGDGTADYLDFCPDLSGPPEFDGCPLEDDGDIDGDGVFDFDDLCPNEYGLLENDGCPADDGGVDSDGDGLLDDEDFCPNEYGPLENDGCPDDDGGVDSDGDGLLDDEDFCPNEYGPLENDGCPWPEE